MIVNNDKFGNMTRIEPTEVLGDTINAWDRFYQKHFDEIYTQCLEMCHNTLKAKDLTDKIFTKIFLANPASILDEKDNLLKNELAILFPYYEVTVDRKFELSAGRLLHLFYQPN